MQGSKEQVVTYHQERYLRLDLDDSRALEDADIKDNGSVEAESSLDARRTARATIPEDRATSSSSAVLMGEDTTATSSRKASAFDSYMDMTQTLGMKSETLEKIWRDKDGDLHRAVDRALEASAAASIGRSKRVNVPPGVQQRGNVSRQ